MIFNQLNDELNLPSDLEELACQLTDDAEHLAQAFPSPAPSPSCSPKHFVQRATLEAATLEDSLGQAALGQVSLGPNHSSKETYRKKLVRLANRPIPETRVAKWFKERAYRSVAAALLLVGTTGWYATGLPWIGDQTVPSPSGTLSNGFAATDFSASGFTTTGTRDNSRSNAPMNGVSLATLKSELANTNRNNQPAVRSQPHVLVVPVSLFQKLDGPEQEALLDLMEKNGVRETDTPL